MASHQNQNHPQNQPRRKRNKKPVKRYSEEYSNRPNPYTGYSADGNYHPEAKVRPARPFAQNSAQGTAAHDVEEARRMADAVWPPAAAGQVPPTVNIPAPKWTTADSAYYRPAPEESAVSRPVPPPAAATPRPAQTGGAGRPGESRSFRMDGQSEPDGSRLPNIQNTQNTQNVQNTQNKQNTQADGSPHRTGSHRHKHADREAEKRAKTARMEAKKATLDKIAKGVAAHSVSEQMIDDIASITDAIESRSRANAAEKAAEKTTGIDWDAYYDAVFPQRVSEPVGAADDKTRPGFSKRRMDFGEETGDEPMPFKPVELGDDEPLPYDRIVEENEREAQEAAEKVTEEAPAPVSADLLDNTLDDVSEDSIGRILDEVERQKLASAAEAGAEGALLGEALFDDPASDDWHALIPSEQGEEPLSEEPSVWEDDGSERNLLSQRLLESYMELENQTEQEAAQAVADARDAESEDVTAQVDINALLESAPAEEEPVTVEVPAASAGEAGETAAEAEPVDGLLQVEIPDAPVVEVELSAIENEIFGETEPAAAAPENEDNSQVVPQEEDASAPVGKMAEAAELAEVMRQENELSSPVEDADDEDEEIRQYTPRPRTEEEPGEVFESVLIVDDNQKVVDPVISEKQDETLYLHTSETTENPTAVFRLPDGPFMLPDDFDDADFQEQWLDDDEESDEAASRTKRARRRVSAFIGAVVVIIAGLLLVNVIRTVVTGFSSMGGTGEKKAEYIDFIAPVVLNDPAPFETIEKADNQMLLESAIWRMIDQMGKTEGFEYTYDDTHKIVVSADQVQKSGRELFGAKVQLNMNVMSESDGSAIYYYDSVEDSFHISTIGVSGPVPVITRMATRSDHVSLIVGYVNQSDMMLVSSEEEPECYKYMEYVLAVRPNGSYYIQSIRNYTEDNA